MTSEAVDKKSRCLGLTGMINPLDPTVFQPANLNCGAFSILCFLKSGTVGKMKRVYILESVELSSNLVLTY